LVRIDSAGPGEGFAVLVVVSAEVLDLGDQLLDRRERAAADGLPVMIEKKRSTWLSQEQ